MKGSRDPLLGFVRGAALLLVVFGHALGGDPAIAAWVSPPSWTLLVGAWIYSFHMPLFMFCAGWAQGLSSSDRTGHEAWSFFLRRRGRRLLVPFLFAALFLHGPVTALVTDGVGWLEASLGLILGLGGGHLWFLWTLFVIQVVARVFGMLRLPWFALVPIALASSIGSLARENLGWSDLLEWNSVLRFLPWYLVGFLGPRAASRIRDRFRGNVPRMLLLGVAGWALHAGFWHLASLLPDRGNPLLTSLAHLAGEGTALAGVAASVATMALVNALLPDRTSWIEALDRRGMGIYLFHGPLQWGLVRLWAGLALGAPFFPFAAFALGVAGSIAIVRIHASAPIAFVFRRYLPFVGGTTRISEKESP